SQGGAPYFTATLQDQLAEQYSLEALLSQEWDIFTTLDPVLQDYAERTLDCGSRIADCGLNVPHKSAMPQAALVALDPATGAVRAWVGGTNYGKSPFDRVIYAKRQPGSAFKPFVMLAALDARQATLATLLEDKALSLKTPRGRWSPRNYDRVYRG